MPCETVSIGSMSYVLFADPTRTRVVEVRHRQQLHGTSWCVCGRFLEALVRGRRKSYRSSTSSSCTSAVAGPASVQLYMVDGAVYGVVVDAFKRRHP